MAGEGPYFITFSGNRYHFLDPDLGEITIWDIAHSLALQCRYAGHSPLFYSVAEHAVLVSQVVPQELALAGLMHDATEAYVSDLIRPCKLTLRAMRGAELRATGRFAPSDYDKLESIAWTAIAARFDLPPAIPATVMKADKMVGQRECLAMGRPDYGTGHEGEYHEPADVGLRFLSPAEAEDLFLARWQELTGCATRTEMRT
jgi:hypothetical protein